MDSATVTYWLAALNLAVGVMAVAFTPRPAVTLFHIMHLFLAVSFGFRPMLAASVDGYTNYPTIVGIEAYNYGLLYQLVFSASLSAAYVCLYTVDRCKVRQIVKGPSSRSLYAAFGLGALAVVVLQLTSGGSWLPSMRETSMNVASPGAKYLFPIGVIALSAFIPGVALAFISKARVNRPLLIALLAVSFILLSLLFVRGMVISGVFLVFWAVEKTGKLRASHVVMGMAAIFILGNLLRPIGELISLSLAPAQPSAQAAAQAVVERLSPMDKLRVALLYTTNNDAADSWPVAIQYVREYGVQEGETFAAIPARFAGTGFRVQSGILTGSDILNIYHYGDDYVRYSFGFNVTLANELYLNFGAAAMFLGMIPGLMMWAADRWMMRVRLVSSSALFIAYVFYAYGFLGEPAATIQWVVGALLIAWMVETLARLRRWKPEPPEDEPATSPVAEPV